MTTTRAGNVHHRRGAAGFFCRTRAGVRPVFEVVVRKDVRFEEREEDDAADRPFADDRFAVAEAPLRVFLGAISPEKSYEKASVHRTGIGAGPFNPTTSISLCRLDVYLRLMDTNACSIPLRPYGHG